MISGVGKVEEESILENMSWKFAFNSIRYIWKKERAREKYNCTDPTNYIYPKGYQERQNTKKMDKKSFEQSNKDKKVQ